MLQNWQGKHTAAVIVAVIMGGLGGLASAMPQTADTVHGIVSVLGGVLVWLGTTSPDARQGGQS